MMLFDFAFLVSQLVNALMIYLIVIQVILLQLETFFTRHQFLNGATKIKNRFSLELNQLIVPKHQTVEQHPCFLLTLRELDTNKRIYCLCKCPQEQGRSQDLKLGGRLYCWLHAAISASNFAAQMPRDFLLLFFLVFFVFDACVCCLVRTKLFWLKFFKGLGCLFWVKFVSWA